MSVMVRQEHRNLMAFVLALDPAARRAYMSLKRLGAQDLHPDYMYVRQPDGKYEQMVDPSAWNGRMRDTSIHLTMLKTRDGEWYVTGG